MNALMRQLHRTKRRLLLEAVAESPDPRLRDDEEEVLLATVVRTLRQRTFSDLSVLSYGSTPSVDNGQDE